MKAIGNFFRPLSEWFLKYPLLFLSAAAIIGILYGFGRGLGLPYLFWHETKWLQFFAGVGLAWLLTDLSAVGYLLDAEKSWIKNLSRTRNWYYLRTFGVLMAIALLSSLNADTFEVEKTLPLIIGGILGSILFWFTSTQVHQLPIWNYGLINWVTWLLRKMPRLAEADNRILRRHAIALLSFIAFGLFFVTLSAFFIFILPPSWGLCIGLGLLVRIYGAIHYYFRTYHPGTILALLLLLALLSMCSAKNSRFGEKKELDYDIATPIPPNPSCMKQPDGLLEDSEVLDNWKKHINQKNPKLVVVATSGGGIRAAAWTMSVLTKLESEILDFASSIRVITGASGGMVGAAHYVAHRRLEQMGCNPLPDRMESVMKDSLSPVARYLFLRDVPLIPFYGIANFQDRGWALQNAWAKNTNYLMDVPVRELRTEEEKGTLPSLIFSPMLVQDGRRLLISNLHLATMLDSEGPCCCPDLNSYPGCDKENRYSLSALEFFCLFPESQLKLATAARMSASFPYVTPASFIPTDPMRHVVDAGYYDNYGIDVASLWIYKNWEKLMEAGISGILLVQIRDVLELKRTSYTTDGESGKILLPWVTTPIKAMLSAREASMSYRNDEILQALYKRASDKSDFLFRTVTFEFSGEAALSWYLTRNEKDEIKSGMLEKKNDKRLAALKQWWYQQPSVLASQTSD
ncbi:hypothetical protein L0222_17390 [bacterium]|nr:hypothetical protein [bacterium]MCI0603973.1 hypothetical protein [bacterium]